ncbi:MAG: ribonuclease R [Candidatus Pacebacteria bacterium]|nr:ribonuclease R [Candidatus Paceibacterota bacterium]
MQNTTIKELKVGAQFEGSINISTKGVGYVKVRDLGISIEVPRESLNRAFHGDTVLVEVTSLPPAENPKGKVIDIPRRAKVGYSGTLSFEQGSHCIVTNDGRMYTPIIIPEDKLSGAKAGDKVFCSITDWPDPMNTPSGEITRVLGKPLENNAEMLSLALEKGFDDTYPPAVEEEAKAIHEKGITEEEINNRRDFRKITTFTIDPADAKDFDDAISVQFLENGNTEVGIHIADVSHYVTPGTALDAEAYRRATSVYLVDRTIPMLPEVLSNELCSLNPDIDRLTMSAVFEITPKFEVVNEWFGKTVIHSHYRFTYENAQEVLDKKEGSFLKELQAALAIAQDLEKKRFESGALSLDSAEVKFILDETGHPTGVYTKVRGQTHHMIEELMLLANKKVAKFIATRDNNAQEIFMYRIHDKPDLDRMNDLHLFLKRLGHTLPLDKDGLIPSRALNDLLISLEGKPEKETVQISIIRSMAKAIYSTKNIGHYGLAFEYYTHFTSPIRRYPDLVVHRLLESYLHNETVGKETWASYEKIAAHSSTREKEAADAERASIKYKQTEYMADRIGQQFDGSVTGISMNGIFVEEKESKCEGMIRLRDLGNDYYEYNEKELAIVGKRTGKKFVIGDKVKIKVASADITKKMIDYKLV